MRQINSFLRRILSSEEKRAVVENFLSLSSLQAANYILPLITLPYLVRVLGPGKYGLIAFAQALTQYLITFSDYGFILSATRDISVNRDDPQKVSDIFSSVMTVKSILVAASFILLCSIVVFIPRFREDGRVYLYMFGVVFGNFLFPTWFLQGMEKMRYIAILNIVSKLIFTILIFVFIRNEGHYIYVPVINSFGYITAGVLSLWLIFKRFNVRFSLPRFGSVRRQLKSGWHVFVSRISISLYTTTNVFLLGLFANDAVVGYYAAGEKLIRVVISLFEPVFQALYPYISKLASISRERTIRNLRALLSFSLIASFSIFFVFIFGAGRIVLLILGEKFIESAIIVRILSPLLFVVPVAYILANLTLLPFNLDKHFSRIYFSGGFINIFLLFVTLYLLKLGAVGAALSNLATEVVLAVMMYVVLEKHNIKVLYGG